MVRSTTASRDVAVAILDGGAAPERPAGRAGRRSTGAAARRATPAGSRPSACRPASGDGLTAHPRRATAPSSFAGVSGRRRASRTPAVQPSTATAARPPAPTSRGTARRSAATRPGHHGCPDARDRSDRHRARTSCASSRRRAGLPVIGGEVVVGLRPDRQLGSMLGHRVLSRAAVPGATVTRAGGRARRRWPWRQRPSRPGAALTVRPPTGGWVFDPAVLGRSHRPRPRARGRVAVRGRRPGRRPPARCWSTTAPAPVLLDLDRVARQSRPGRLRQTTTSRTS